jgi:hypothetical protein
MQFSAGDAAVSGIDFVRGHPRPVLVWTVFGVVVWLIISAIGLLLLGPSYLDLLVAHGPMTPETTRKVLPVLALPLLLIGVPTILAVKAASYRALLSGPAGGRWEGLAFGKREWGLLGVYVLLGLSLAAIELVGILVGIVFAVLKTPGFIALTVIVGFVTVCAMLWIAVRLSLAGVVSIAEGARPLKRSWALTRGRFWSLFGAYMLLGVMFIIFYLLVELVFAIPLLMSLGSGGDFGLFHLDQAPAMSALTLPQMIFRLGPAAIRALLFAAMAAISAGPAVEAYKAFSVETR